MTDADSLYRELKPHVEQLAESLFNASQVFVKKQGAFLPHGAVRTLTGEVRLIMAMPGAEDDLTSALEVLPMLHQALRQSVLDQNGIALAVCEDVTIAREGQRETRAIKVLIEHQRGLCVALYLPFRKKLFGYSFGQIFVVAAHPEVKPWIGANLD